MSEVFLLRNTFFTHSKHSSSLKLTPMGYLPSNSTNILVKSKSVTEKNKSFIFSLSDQHFAGFGEVASIDGVEIDTAADEFSRLIASIPVNGFRL